MHTTTIIITDEQYKKVGRLAFDSKRTLSEIIRNALDQYFMPAYPSETRTIKTSGTEIIASKKPESVKLQEQIIKDALEFVDTSKHERIHQLEESMKSATPLQKNPRCQYPLSVCHTEGNQYKATQYDDAGEVTKVIYLCDKHKAEMQKKGAEISG